MGKLLVLSPQKNIQTKTAEYRGDFQQDAVYSCKTAVQPKKPRFVAVLYIAFCQTAVPQDETAVKYTTTYCIFKNRVIFISNGGF